MKHFILIASITIATNSIIAMEPNYYQSMLTRISEAAKGKPFITIINDSKSSLSIEVGDLEIDKIKSSIHLHEDTQLTFSPYAHPFFLNKQHIKNGTVLKLTLLEQEKPLLIGAHSNIQFGDTIRVDYDKNNNKINIVPDNKIIVKTLYNPYDHIDLNFIKITKTSKISQKNSTPQKANTIS